VIKRGQERLALQIDEMECFENLVNKTFPDTYRDFLIKFNGGAPCKPSIPFDGSKLGINGDTINYFYGFGGFSENIDKSFLNLKHDLPELMVPIANTPSGNHFILSLRDDCSYGKIYYCDHEFEFNEDEVFDEESNVYPECLIKVADSFDILIENMSEE
jgi:hypothetical protein